MTSEIGPQTEAEAAALGSSTSKGSAAGTRVEVARVRGSDQAAVVAPTGPSGERDFFAERLALFTMIAGSASGAFFIMRIVLDATARPASLRIEPFPLFHLAATSIFLATWVAARGRALSEATLAGLDTWGTVAASFFYALMCATMPVSWRPDMLGVLILNAVLVGRAALVPSAPPHTLWISIVSVVPMPAVAFWVFRREPIPGVPVSAIVTPSILWSAFTVVLATLISSVTFHLRRSVARARRLGQYTLVEKIGEGGMGVVYRAEHEMLRRPTAIKLLPPHAAGEDSLRRFEREAQRTARLTSPHTVSVFDFGRTPEGAFYYVMEYLDGMDLERLVRETGPMPPGRVVHVLRQVAEALAEAHGIGLIHRDIKPANVVLSERGGIPDFAKVLDYGLVKDVARASDPRLTREDVIAGTPQYLAPEMIREGNTSDPRSDLYALGAVAYFLLTGKNVFEGRPMEVIAKHLREEPVPPSKRLGRPLPEKLERLVMELLEKDPDRRPESAAALIARLDEIEADSGVETWSADAARAWWAERSTVARRPVPAT